MTFAQVTNPPVQVPTIPFADQLIIVAVICFVVFLLVIALWNAGKYVWSEYKISLEKSRAFQAEQSREQRDVLKQIADQLTKSQCESTDAVSEMAKEFRAVGVGVAANGNKLDIILNQTRPNYTGDERRSGPRPWTGAGGFKEK